MLLIDVSLRSPSDKDPGVLQMAHFGGILAAGVVVIRLKDADQKLTVFHLLNHLIILRVVHEATTAPGLHGELPAAGGTGAFLVMPSPVNGDLLTAGCAEAGHAFCPFPVIVEEIGRKNIFVRPPL